MHTGCDELAVATDRQRHEDQEYSSPRAHCKCNDPGIFVFVSVLILAMIQDQALVASKHYLVETNENSPGDKQVVGSFKILKKSYFKISKVSFAESFHAALRS